MAKERVRYAEEVEVEQEDAAIPVATNRNCEDEPWIVISSEEETSSYPQRLKHRFWNPDKQVGAHIEKGWVSGDAIRSRLASQCVIS